MNHGTFHKWGNQLDRGRIAALGETARDPGTMHSSPLEPHLESISRLTEARLEVRKAIDRLMEMAARARSSLEKIEEVSSGSIEQPEMPRHYALELQVELSDELSALDRKIQRLQDEHESLLLSERRLIASLRRGAITREIDDATDASHQARGSAEEALAGFGTGLHRLGRAIDRARVMGRTLETKAQATGRISGIESESTESSTFAERQATNLIRRYSRAIETATDDTRNIPLERGMRAGQGLLFEYQQLKSLLDRSDLREHRDGARLVILNELVCRHGLTNLSNAYGSTLTMPDGLDWTDGDEVCGVVEEQLTKVETCERSIREARLELLESGEDVQDVDLVKASDTLREVANLFPGDPADVPGEPI